VRALLRVLSYLLLGVVLLGAVASIAARFHDGPLAMLPGGPLETGALVSARGVDWSFLAEVDEVELQLVEPPRSRTVWIVLHEESPVVPCGFLDWPLFKQWPYEAVEDGRAILRVRGVRYEVELERIEDPVTRLAVARRVAEKYSLPLPDDEPPDPAVAWFFRVVPRS